MTPTTTSAGRAAAGTPTAPDVLPALGHDARVVDLALLERLLDDLDRL